MTIGETTIQEVEELYREYFDVRIKYSEASGETLIYFYEIDGETIYRRVDTCVVNGVIVAAGSSYRTFPTTIEIEKLYNDATPEPPSPATFHLLGIDSFIWWYGVPDVVTYSSEPTHRVAFWFEEGVAARFYVRYDLPDRETPPAFGALSDIVYFPFQDVERHAERWPFNQTYPEERYITYAAPFVDDDLPTERNPFDFDAIMATITAVPSRTPTPVVTQAP